MDLCVCGHEVEWHIQGGGCQWDDEAAGGDNECDCPAYERAEATSGSSNQEEQ